MIAARIILRISDDLLSLISIFTRYVSVASMPLMAMNAAYLAKIWHLLVAGAVGNLIVGGKGHSSTEVSTEIPPYNNKTAVIEKLVKGASIIDDTGMMVKEQLVKYILRPEPLLNELKKIWKTGSFSLKSVWKSPVFRKMRSDFQQRTMKNVTRLRNKNTLF